MLCPAVGSVCFQRFRLEHFGAFRAFLVTAGYSFGYNFGYRVVLTLVGLARVELATYGLGNRRSIQLSYSPYQQSYHVFPAAKATRTLQI
jgi:hypothetical protein